MNTNKQNYDIENLLGEIGNTKVPQQVEAKMRHQFDDFEKRLAGKEEKSWIANIPEVLQKVFTPKVKIVTAFTVIILMILVTTFNQTPDSSGGDLYAAVVAQFRAMYAISYEIEIAPFTSVTISKKEPGLSRIVTSWGADITTDHVAGKSLVLLHYDKKYLLKEKDVEPQKSDFDEIYESFRNLPEKADSTLGTKSINSQKVAGYRVWDDEESIDTWINPRDSALVQVDINFYKDKVMVHQMHIRNFKLNDEVELSDLSFTPPKGYQPATDADQNETKGKIQF